MAAVAATLAAGAVVATVVLRSDTGSQRDDAGFGWYASPPDASGARQDEPTTPTDESIPFPPEDEPAYGDEAVPPVPRAASRFAWTASATPPRAFTLTVLRGILARDALLVLAPRPDLPPRPVAEIKRTVERADATADTDEEYARVPRVVAAVARGEYTLVLEEYTDLAARALPRLSRRSTVAALRDDVDSDGGFTVARGGRVVRDFDPALGDGSGRPLPEEHGLTFGADADFHWLPATSLELLRRVTGYEVTPADLDVDTYGLAVGVAGA